MPPIDSPWEVVTKEIDRLKQNNVTSVIIDFHAEATAEKICFSKYLAKKYNNAEQALVKGVIGTHTHVQTADEKYTKEWRVLLMPVLRSRRKCYRNGVLNFFQTPFNKSSREI